MIQPWSSLDKEESLACQITSPFNNKLGCFQIKMENNAFLKQPIFLLNGEGIWRANDPFLSKELHSLAREHSVTLEWEVTLYRCPPNLTGLDSDALLMLN